MKRSSISSRNGSLSSSEGQPSKKRKVAYELSPQSSDDSDSAVDSMHPPDHQTSQINEFEQSIRDFIDGGFQNIELLRVKFDIENCTVSKAYETIGVLKNQPLELDVKFMQKLDLMKQAWQGFMFKNIDDEKRQTAGEEVNYDLITRKENVTLFQDYFNRLCDIFGFCHALARMANSMNNTTKTSLLCESLVFYEKKTNRHRLPTDYVEFRMMEWGLVLMLDDYESATAAIDGPKKFPECVIYEKNPFFQFGIWRPAHFHQLYSHNINPALHGNINKFLNGFKTSNRYSTVEDYFHQETTIEKCRKWLLSLNPDQNLKVKRIHLSLWTMGIKGDCKENSLLLYFGNKKLEIFKTAQQFSSRLMERKDRINGDPSDTQNYFDCSLSPEALEAIRLHNLPASNVQEDEEDDPYWYKIPTRGLDQIVNQQFKITGPDGQVVLDKKTIYMFYFHLGRWVMARRGDDDQVIFHLWGESQTGKSMIGNIIKGLLQEFAGRLSSRRDLYHELNASNTEGKFEMSSTENKVAVISGEDSGSDPNKYGQRLDKHSLFGISDNEKRDVAVKHGGKKQIKHKMSLAFFGNCHMMQREYEAGSEWGPADLAALHRRLRTFYFEHRFDSSNSELNEDYVKYHKWSQEEKCNTLIKISLAYYYVLQKRKLWRDAAKMPPQFRATFLANQRLEDFRYMRDDEGTEHMKKQSLEMAADIFPIVKWLKGCYEENQAKDQEAKAVFHRSTLYWSPATDAKSVPSRNVSIKWSVLKDRIRTDELRLGDDGKESQKFAKFLKNFSLLKYACTLNNFKGRQRIRIIPDGEDYLLVGIGDLTQQ